MTIEEHINFLKPKVTPELVTKKVLMPVSTGLIRRIVTRIAGEGKNTAGKQIGKYSTTPAYFSKSQFIKSGAFKPIGKNGTKKVAVFDIRTRKIKKVAVKPINRPRTSMYLREGYKELRLIQNLRADRMNMQYSGKLLKSYVAQPYDEKTVAMGFNNFRAALIRQGQEKKRGRIFSPGIDELNETMIEINARLKPYIFTVVNVIND